MVNDVELEHFVKDMGLTKQGDCNIAWAETTMPVLMKIRERFIKEKPLAGIRISACLHVTKETAVLMKTLVAGGAQVRLNASNPLSTQDDVAAALAASGINVYAVKGMDDLDYYKCLNACLDLKPHITLDDGADLISTVHSKRTDLMQHIIGGQEETTTGVIRLRAMANDGELKFPVVAVNDTPTKHLMDNIIGTGQSTIDGILRGTNALIAGSNFVVIGYGHCGKGLAKRADGMGAKVIVVEIDPVEALRAHFEGYRVMNMNDAAKEGEIFVTVTGNKHVLREEHFKMMKDGAILANTGHFNVEIDIPALEKLAKSKVQVKNQVHKYTLANGHNLYLLGEGRLVNLALAEGHPSMIMDMSFANQALISEFLVKNKGKLKAQVIEVPKEIDEQVARVKLAAHGLGLEVLTDEQVKYLASWREGT